MNYSSCSPSGGAVLLRFCSSSFTLPTRRKDQKDFSMKAADLSENVKL